MTREEFRPLSFWSFNGDMQEDEIRTQIRQLKEQGYGGFFMHARAGMTLEYLGEDWFHACRVAVQEAKEQGLKAWLYDENGWPSGFAGGLVPALGDDYTAKHLYFIKRPPVKSDGQVLAAYKKTDDGKYERIYSETADMYCCLGQLKGYADLLNPKAINAFIQFTHEKYYQELGEYFGTVIPGIFTDEPQLVGKFPYTFAYPKLYSEKYGYDFFEKAWMLCEDGNEYSAFKYQAATLVAELLTKAFTSQIEEWCKKHSLQFTGHFSNEDGLCNQTTANYNLMEQYRIMSRPGIDFLGRRLTSPVLVKQISDAAYLGKKQVVTSESFGCSGWDVTFNDLLWIAEWQAAFGINSIVTHLSAYSIKGRRKRDYPAFFSYQEPWWETFKTVSERIADVNDFLSVGKRNVEMLVVYPITSMWCALAGSKRFSDESRYLSNQFRLLVEHLLDLQKDFLIVTEEDLEKFCVKENKLCKDDVCCETIIVPDSLSLNLTTYDKLQEMAELGGNVVFINRLPQLCEGKPSDKAKGIPAEIVENRSGLLDKYFLETNQSGEILAVDGEEGRAVSGIIVSPRFLETEQRVFLMNPSRNDTKQFYLKVKGNKQIGDFQTFGDGEHTYAPMVLAPTESKCLCIKDKEVSVETAVVPRYAKAKELQVAAVTLLEQNALTVDRCDIYINDVLLFADADPVKCVDMLYESAYKAASESLVRLVYRFTAGFAKSIPKNMSLVVESDELTKILVNGNDVLPYRNGWWIDKSFHMFPIAEYVCNGENTVVIEFSIVRPQKLEEQGEFEGYRNRFCYPIEPESIYVTGAFDVTVSGTIMERVETLHVDGQFILADATQKQAGELTKQNLWFYRGNVCMRTTFESGKGKQKIRLEDFQGTAAEIRVNGKKVGMIYRAPYTLSLEGYTKLGENSLELILYGSNRNLLGPHHHISGNPHFVGVPTFLGKKGFTDFIYPQITEDDTWAEGYSFVKVSCGRIILEEV